MIEVPERTLETGNLIYQKYNAVRKKWTDMVSQPNH
jgi:hypothetical protein